MEIFTPSGETLDVGRTTEELRAATSAALTLCVGPRVDPDDTSPHELNTDAMNVRREELSQRPKPRFRHRPRFGT